jgi:hypothetical protein
VRTPQPEVLISQEEAVALRRLFDAIASRRLEPTVLPEFESPTPLAPIDEIVLEPITLSPIVRLGSGEGVRQ